MLKKTNETMTKKMHIIARPIIENIFVCVTPK